MTLKVFYINLSQASVLLPIIAGLLNYKRLTWPYKVFFYFFVFCAAIEASSDVMKSVLTNNMPILHLYTLVEFLVFSTVYYSHFQEDRKLRLFIKINAIFFVALCLADALFINGIWAWNTLSRGYSFISMFCYTLIYFYFMFQKDGEQYNARHPMFWISCSALIYFGTNLLYVLSFKKLMLADAGTAIKITFVHAGLNIIAHILYAQSFRCFRKREGTS